jgi:hypothetical protein
MFPLFESDQAFYFTDHAVLLDAIPEDREVAWAEKHIVKNPAHAYVLGKFVEADTANSNKQFFHLEDLRSNKTTIANSPLNIDHNHNRIVGTFVAADLVYPTGTSEDSADAKPYVEALGVVWKAHYPDEYAKIREAYDMGALTYSMEAVPETIQCGGEAGCGETFEYAGRQSSTYCSHLNDSASEKILINPNFTGGALLLPPTKPGWKKADVHTMVANASYEDPEQWEYVMSLLMAQGASELS